MTRSLFTSMLTILAVALSGCSLFQSEPTIAPCLKANQQELFVEWGSYDNYELRTGAGYQLTSRGDLQSALYADSTEATHELWVKADTYCATVESVMQTFLKVQALHSPGTQGRFIRYSNPTTGVYLQAVWNPELETFQSRDMRRLYDELMLLTVEKSE